ncbi:DEAD/DEAH box helicase [Micromonospora sp. NPDC005206]|uniref:DEAD/DEAH box helicase n=1 Tax=Micromonospora sp. NPDC005206 TaxID=3157022 RepID=UPI0033A545DE
MTAIDRLHPGLAHHIVNTLGWSSLRPLQEAAAQPLLVGSDALLLAPTAGGKTEAAVFPMLTSMIEYGWRGLSVLYVCPLRALLNNLQPRIDGYARWVGRTAGVWHGDTKASQRRAMRVERPDILLTTPESLESLLVSPSVNPREFFGDVQAVIVDEVHAFAGDDRGWHLLAVLERISHLANRPIQRIGLSATVGNPGDLVRWLQGTGSAARAGVVVAPEADGSSSSAEIEVDYVGNVQNAATVISALHRGEKRLVFCETRRRAEELALALRSRTVTTFVSHSSLSRDERRRAEQAFAEERDCVIVATSTLELGIDVGDLDRVIQLDAPRSVASFLQRLGRTGRRAGSERNMLFLASSASKLLHATGLLRLWNEGFVEPITPPVAPRHIAAQQLLALCLQEGRTGESIWREWWGDLPIFDESTREIVEWLVASGHLERDSSGMLFIGPEAERRYGRRNFMELLAVFTAAPEFTVLHGRQEVGGADPLMLMRKVNGPRVLSLAGRPWRVTHIDWTRRRCFVEPTDIPGRSLWQGMTPPQSFELSRAQRDVLLGATPDAGLSKRATTALAKLREEAGHRAWKAGTVVESGSEVPVWWTWAGERANATLAAALPDVVDPEGDLDDHSLRLREDISPDRLRAALNRVAGDELPQPVVADEALHQLKFAEMLPPELARTTLGLRLADTARAQSVLTEHVRWYHSPGS